MPKVLELKEIDGELWARVGQPGELPSGVALWTPQEVELFRLSVLRDIKDMLADACMRSAEIATIAGRASDDARPRRRQ